MGGPFDPPPLDVRGLIIIFIIRCWEEKNINHINVIMINLIVTSCMALEHG